MNVLSALYNSLGFNYFKSKTADDSNHIIIKACDPVYTPWDRILLLQNARSFLIFRCCDITYC